MLLTVSCGNFRPVLSRICGLKILAMKAILTQALWWTFINSWMTICLARSVLDIESNSKLGSWIRTQVSHGISSIISSSESTGSGSSGNGGGRGTVWLVGDEISSFSESSVESPDTREFVSFDCFEGELRDSIDWAFWTCSGTGDTALWK